MSFQRWSEYADLLDRLRANSTTWSGATTFAEFDSLVRTRCADLVRDGDERGYDALITGLDADYADRDRLYEQVRISALARPAADVGWTGAEWAGYWVSTRRDGTQVYAKDRFTATWAAPDATAEATELFHDEETGLLYDAEHWYLPDGKTEVWADSAGFKDADGNRYVNGVRQTGQTAQTESEPTVDPATNRWRRWNETDKEFEYHHTSDAVWERLRDGWWYRRFDDRLGWLAYDEASGTWLDRTTPTPTWRRRDEVGTAVTPAPAEVLDRMSDADQATLSDLKQRALAMKPASMTDEEALRVLGKALSARTADVPKA